MSKIKEGEDVHRAFFSWSGDAYPPHHDIILLSCIFTSADLFEGEVTCTFRYLALVPTRILFSK